MDILNQASAVLLDLNGTFMFGHDRFGPEQDFFETYRQLGGQHLDGPGVRSAVRAALDSLQTAYDSPAAWDSFPGVSDVLRDRRLNPEDAGLIEAVIASHEMGFVPESHIAFIHGLARTHRVGLVSNLWSRSAPWRAYLDGIGLLSLFHPAVFSSDGSSVKPSPAIFQRALQAWPNGTRILFVGDSLTRDIIPAKHLGLLTAWVTTGQAGHPSADVTLATLQALSP